MFTEFPFAPFEERVLFHLGGDEVGHFEVRELQHLDRLPHLRRNGQSLRLTQFKPLGNLSHVWIPPC